MSDPTTVTDPKVLEKRIEALESELVDIETERDVASAHLWEAEREAGEARETCQSIALAARALLDELAHPVPMAREIARARDDLSEAITGWWTS